MPNNVEVINVSKKFNIGFERNNGALGRVISLVSGKEPKKELQALKNISFEALPGEIVGIIGRNGSGKSTLLRIIAGIYCQDSGQVITHGRVDYLSGLSNGLRPKLTMRENIFLMGSIIGLSQNEVSQKIDEIVEFSGLSNFVGTKVYQFSSGMQTRLCFSTTIHCLKHCNSDVVLLDEVFGAGGDIDFEDKATEKMKEFIHSGATVILASHKLETIQKYCNRALLLEKGEIVMAGNPQKVVEFYKD